MTKKLENVNDGTFKYLYSAEQNKEIEVIRKKYLPKEENKFEELKRLDAHVQRAGMIESLSIGIVGILIFGIAMCIGLDVFAGGMVLAVIVGIIGCTIMVGAYPVYRKISERVKAEYAEKIIALTNEL